ILHEDCLKISKSVLKEIEAKSPSNCSDTNKFLSEINDDLEDFSNTPASPNEQILPNHTQLACDFEAVLTHFSKTYSYAYTPNNGWLPILSTLYSVLLCRSRNELYAYFTSVHHRFVASGFDKDNRACTVLRLLLQYHEPQLCSFIHCKKISISDFANNWLMSLFSSIISHQTLVLLWDVCFLLSDPLFPLQIAVVMLINAKESIEDQENLLQFITQLPALMQPDDVISLRDVSLIFSEQTPSSFRTHYLPLLFGNADPEPGQCLLSDSMCIMVMAEEVLQYTLGISADKRIEYVPPFLSFHSIHSSNSSRDDALSDCSAASRKSLHDACLRYFIIDLRTADQYNAGHLPNAFYLDANLMLSNLQAFESSVESLLSSHTEGEHLVLISSGEEEDVNLQNMIVSHLLRMNVSYISVLDGGFRAIHEALGYLGCSRVLQAHNPLKCQICLTGEASLDKAVLVTSTFSINAGKIAQSANEAAKKAVQSIKKNPVLSNFMSRGFSSLVRNAPAAPVEEKTSPKKVAPLQNTHVAPKAYRSASKALIS
ncbi:hypothetical protein Ciccas_012584, partial [Cichlidogyrus casuarinus]